MMRRPNPLLLAFIAAIFVSANPLFQQSAGNSVTPTPIWDVLGVLPTLEDLLRTNGGCELPCWWGFNVGETSEEDWLNFLHEQWFDRIPDDIEPHERGSIGTTTFLLQIGDRERHFIRSYFEEGIAPSLTNRLSATKFVALTRSGHNNVIWDAAAVGSNT